MHQASKCTLTNINVTCYTATSSRKALKSSTEPYNAPAAPSHSKESQPSPLYQASTCSFDRCRANTITLTAYGAQKHNLPGPSPRQLAPPALAPTRLGCAAARPLQPVFSADEAPAAAPRVVAASALPPAHLAVPAAGPPAGPPAAPDACNTHVHKPALTLSLTLHRPNTVESNTQLP